MSSTNIRENSLNKANSTFVLHKSWNSDIDRLTDRQAGKLFKAILKYVADKPMALKSGKDVTVLFTKITTQIDQEHAKYNPVTGKYHWNYKAGKSFRVNTNVL